MSPIPRGVECWRFQFLKIILNQRSINDISLEILLEEVKFILIQKKKLRHCHQLIHPSSSFFYADITPDIAKLSDPKKRAASCEDVQSWDPWPGGCRNFLDSLDPIKVPQTDEIWWNDGLERWNFFVFLWQKEKRWENRKPHPFDMEGLALNSLMVDGLWRGEEK